MAAPGTERRQHFLTRSKATMTRYHAPNLKIHCPEKTALKSSTDYLSSHNPMFKLWKMKEGPIAR